MLRSLVGSEMCIRDRPWRNLAWKRYAVLGGRRSFFAWPYLAGKSFFSQLFVEAGLPRAPPSIVREKFGSKTAWMVFFVSSAFLVNFRTYLKQKKTRYTFSRHLPLFLNIMRLKCLATLPTRPCIVLRLIAWFSSSFTRVMKANESQAIIFREVT